MNFKRNAQLSVTLIAVMILTMLYILKIQNFRQYAEFSNYVFLRGNNAYVTANDMADGIFKTVRTKGWLLGPGNFNGSLVNYSRYFDHGEYLVYNPKCRISHMEPWDKSVQRHFKVHVPLRCSNRPLLTSVERMKNGTYLLRIVNEAIKSYTKFKTDQLTCCYSEITRITENPLKYDFEADKKIRYSACKFFGREKLLPNTTEFIRVKCMLRRKKESIKEVYRDAHAVVPILPSALRKMKDCEERKMARNSSTTYEDLLNKTIDSSKLNILIIGIDSVSRLNAIRMMPNTVKYLKQNEWVELMGYTKIADNTFPNLMAILSGFNASELRKKGLYKLNRKLDDLPAIWKQFSDVGYITAYAEDTPNISTFNYLRTGFVNKPTDYYLRPFMNAVHSSLVTRKVFGLPVCVGPVAPVDHMLNYARRFLQSFNDYNHFSLFWMNSLTHNNPSTAENMDYRILQFLRDLSDIGTYHNTVIFLFSDHGTRFGEFRHSFIGYYEDRLPFMYIWIPEWFRKKYTRLYGNLLNNQRRLTSPYDVHLTLKSILYEDYETSHVRNNGTCYEKRLSACPKCVSLFDNVPWYRGCEDAAIEDVWCMCNQFQIVRDRDPTVRKIGIFVRDVLNNKTQQLLAREHLSKSMCYTWIFKRVVRVHEIVPAEENFQEEFNNVYIIKEPDVRKKRLFLILVELNPGRTKYEAVVEVSTSSTGTSVKFSAKGSPALLDGYYKFSKCVKSPMLKFYCYCTKQ